MSDGKLIYEIGVEGTDKAARGLDDVAAATRRNRDSAYSARQAHENWANGYRNEVFSEMAEKIKRVSHVSRETNPSLKWMGEGFKDAGKGVSSATDAMKDLRAGTYSAYTANLAFSRLMRGDVVGAAQNAALAVKSLWTTMLANPFTLFLAGIAAAVAGLKLLMDWHDSAKEKAREHAREISALGDDLNEVLYGSVSENVQSNAERMKNEGDRDGLQSGIEARKNANIRLEQVARDQKDAIDSIKVGGFGKDKEQKAKDNLVGQFQDTLSQMRDNKATIREYEKAIAEIDNAEKKRQKEQREADEKAERDKEIAEQTRLRKAQAEEAKITREKERQLAIDNKARESLAIKMEEYNLSKKTNQEQLAAVNAKIAALRQSTANPTTADKENMLSLVKKRDQIQDAIDREKPGETDEDIQLHKVSGRAPWKPGSSFRSRLTKSRLTGASKSFSANLRGSAFRSTARDKTEITLRERSDETVNVKGVDKMTNYLREIRESVK